MKTYRVYFNRFGVDSNENLKRVYSLFEKLQSKYAHLEISYIARSRIIDTYYLSILWYSLPYLKLDEHILKKFETE